MTDKTCKALDVVEFAAQTGRLDFLNSAIAILGVFIGLTAIFSFFHFKNEAKKQAKVTAKKEAKKIAERVANEYIQENLLDILQANANVILSIDDDSANEIAKSQEIGDQK